MIIGFYNKNLINILFEDLYDWRQDTPFWNLRKPTISPQIKQKSFSNVIAVDDGGRSPDPGPPEWIPPSPNPGPPRWIPPPPKWASSQPDLVLKSNPNLNTSNKVRNYL